MEREKGMVGSDDPDLLGDFRKRLAGSNVLVKGLRKCERFYVPQAYSPSLELLPFVPTQHDVAVHLGTDEPFVDRPFNYLSDGPREQVTEGHTSRSICARVEFQRTIIISCNGKLSRLVKSTRRSP